MNLEEIENKKTKLINLIRKYFSVLDEYRNGKGKKDDFQYLYEEISDFYVEEKNKFIKKKYGGMVTDDDWCTICLGEAEEDNLLYSHERIDLRGEDGNPIPKNTACFFHVNCLKNMIKHNLRIDESEIDNYYIECPKCRSVLIRSKLENYENDKKRFVAIKKTDNTIQDFRNIHADWNFGEDRLIDRLISIFEIALLMLVWLIFFITIYEYSVNQDNILINRIEYDLHHLQELNANLYALNRYDMNNENEAIRVLNILLTTFYDNINYENRVILNDNMDNNDEFIEAFSNALNRAFPHNELGGKKKRKKKSMKRKKSKKRREKKNKTKKKGGRQRHEYHVSPNDWHKGLTEPPGTAERRRLANEILAEIKNKYDVLEKQWREQTYILNGIKISYSSFKENFIGHIRHAIQIVNLIGEENLFAHYIIYDIKAFYETKLQLLEDDHRGCLPGDCVVSGGKGEKIKKKKN